MEVQAHARCKPCHARDLSCFLSCWTMPGLVESPEEVEGTGQRWQGDICSGGQQSQPWGGYCELLVSPWGCARGRQLCAHPGTPVLRGVGDIVLSPEQWGWPG